VVTRIKMPTAATSAGTPLYVTEAGRWWNGNAARSWGESSSEHGRESTVEMLAVILGIVVFSSVASSVH
jgi:hypothetical protein